ncbi:MAG: rhodanese-like domain-containing protein [Bacteroidales bacterium]
MYSKRIIIISGILFLLVLAAPACKRGDSLITRVSSQEFYDKYRHLLEDEAALVIDGRTTEMFSRGHLPNAINIDADREDLKERLKAHADEPLIVVYCTTSRRSGKIIDTMEEFYQGEIICISDGIQGWTNNGLPLADFKDISPD